MNLRRTVFLILLIVAIAGGAWGAYYARERGFTHSWRELIETEIGKQGYYVDIRRLTLGPFQGLVAQDVRFYQEEKRKTVIAYIDKVILDIDLSQVMDKKVSINTIDFKDADLSLPIDPKDKNSERLQIRRCSARILMPSDKIEIVKAEAEIHGIQVSLKGTLLKPEEKAEDPDSPESKPSAEAKTKSKKKTRDEQIAMISERRQLFHQILTELDAFTFPADQPPRIELDINGPLDNMKDLEMSARISADNLSHKNYTSRQLNALVESNATSVKIRQLHLQDEKGDLRLRGEWLRSENYADFDFDSSIDIQSLAQSVYPSPSIGEVVFFSSPQIAIEGRWHFDQAIDFPQLPLKAIGSFHCEKFGSRGEVFDGLEADFSLADGKYYLRNLRLDHKSGSAIANAFYDLPREDFRFETEIKFDVRSVGPFLEKESTRKFLKRWKFDEESNIYLGITGNGPGLKPSTWKMSGPIDLRNSRLNGVLFDHITLDFECDKRQHYYHNLKMTQGDAVGSADLVSNNLATKQFVIDNGQWNLPLVSGMRAFSPKLADKLTPYRFHQAPKVEISGSIDARKPEQLGEEKRQNDLDVTFSSDQSMDYKFLGKDLRLYKPTGHLQIKENTIHMTDFTAATLDGSLTASYILTNTNEKKLYTADVAIDQVDFRELTRLYSKYESTTGALNARARLSGVLGDLNSIKGTATTTIENGDIFAIPMLGPLSKFLREVMPKAQPGYSVAKHATADITMEDGIIKTENFEALTPAFKFKSNGNVQLDENKVDFEASFHVRGTAGILLAPVSTVVSKMFEYKAEGTMSEPDWRAKYIPRIMPTVKSIIPGGKGKRTTIKPAEPESEKPKRKLFNFNKKSTTDAEE